jgi:hypothetical protein
MYIAHRHIEFKHTGGIAALQRHGKAMWAVIELET